MKNKILAFIQGILTACVVIGIVGLVKDADIFQKDCSTIQGEFQIQITKPEPDTSCFGTDIKNLTRKEVQALIDTRYETFVSEENVNDYIFRAYELLPVNIKESIPLTEVNLIYESSNPLMYYVPNSEHGQIIASDTGIFPEYYALSAIGKQIGSLTGISEDYKFQKAYNSEHGKEWQLEHCSSASEAFAYQFASIVLGGYSDKWNEIHTPVMHSIVKESVLNFDSLKVKNQEKRIAFYAYEDFTQEQNENGLSDKERLDVVLENLDPNIKAIIEETGLTFTFVDDFDGIMEDKEGRKLLGCFSPMGEHPQIYLLKGNEHHEGTILHEIGHFVDWYLRYECRVDFSSICENEFSDSLWIKKNYKEYDEELIAEYFADAFSYYYLDCTELSDYWKTYCPNSCKYIKTAVKSLNSEQGGD